jgi:hypothetical protein
LYEYVFNINESIKDVSSNFAEKISFCATVIERPLKQNGSEITITDARNRSAHPSENISVDWRSFISQFKKVIGEPPVKILSLTVKLTKIARIAQQGAS